MLCKECNYYRSCSLDGSDGAAVSVCDFADMLFLQDTDDMDAEYPCAKIALAEYLGKKAARPDARSIQKIVRPELLRELRENGVCMMKLPEGLLEKKRQRQRVSVGAAE